MLEPNALKSSLKVNVMEAGHSDLHVRLEHHGSWAQRAALPPSSVTDSSSIHLPHVTHPDDAHCCVLHIGGKFVGTHAVDPIDHVSFI